MTDPDSSRHVSTQTLKEYVSAGVMASIPVPGVPEAVLVFDVPNETLRLEVAWDGEQPPTIGEYVHISTDVRHRQGRNWATIAVHGLRFFEDAYPLLRSVVDLIQLDTLTFAQGVAQSLASYHELLAAVGEMPVPEETGLFGELLVVRHLIDSLGPREALSAWRGGDKREEHDLGLPDDDVEIKTTTGEDRRHWITSLNQLTPSIGRRLWLLSIQLTGAGASQAERLPDVVARVEAALPVSLQGLFRTRIAGTRYRAEQAYDSFRLLRLRTAPAFFLVDDAFPRIDRGILVGGGAVLSGIDEVTYAIRLDGVAPALNPPEPLLGLTQEDF